MKIRLSVWMLCALLVTMAGFDTGHAASRRPMIRIGIVKDGPSVRIKGFEPLIMKEILDLTADEFNVRFPSDKRFHGNWTTAGIKQAVDRLLKDPMVDMVIVLGTTAAIEVAQRKTLPKPLIAPDIIYAEIPGLSVAEESRRLKNLHFIESPKNLERDIRMFHRISRFKNLTFIIDRFYLETIPSLKNLFQRIENQYSVKTTVVTGDISTETILKNLPHDTDSVFVTPLLRFSTDEFQKLVSGFIDRRLPSFSMLGLDEVEQGLLAGMAPKSNLPWYARRIALEVQRILSGEDVETPQARVTGPVQLTINMATARAIDFYPNRNILIDAELLNAEDRDIDRKLTLEAAAREALEANLDLMAATKNVAAGQQAVQEARSALFPQVEIGTEGVIIDDDRAEASLGGQAERTWSGFANASQLLYSEPTWSNYAVEKHLQNARISNRDTVKLDIVFEAATAYLNVLRALTFERIETDNLKLTRANLERARIRNTIGVASPSEVYRWESQIATNRQNVLEAQARTRQAMNTLNRILRRPLEELFIAEEADLSDPLMLVSDPRLYPYLENPKKFKIFRDVEVRRGLEIAPELKRFDAEIAAQERIIVSAKRDFWLPTFSVEGNVTERFSEDGEGSGSPQLPPAFAGAFPTSNDTDWSVGIFATFELFKGGKKNATLRRTLEEVSRLRTERAATADRIEERIRFALHLAGASYPGIQNSRDAAEASNKNFDLVSESYVRGVVSIIDLLDAQNAKLVSQQQAANAVYDFLIDTLRIQRAVGEFDFFMSAEEREDVFKRLQDALQGT